MLFWRWREEEPPTEIKIYMGGGDWFTMMDTPTNFRKDVTNAIRRRQFIEIVHEGGRRVCLNPAQMVLAEWQEPR